MASGARFANDAHTPLRRYEVALHTYQAWRSRDVMCLVMCLVRSFLIGLSPLVTQVGVPIGATLKLDSTTVNAMASRTMNTSATDTRSSRNRTQKRADEGTNPPSATKPPKETKLKAQLKEAAGRLKDELLDLQEDLLDETVAKKDAGRMYKALLKRCTNILEDMEPHEDFLNLFKVPFVDIFEPEGVLYDRLGQGMLPSRRARLR